MDRWRGKPDCKIFEQVTGLRVCGADWDPEVERHKFYADLAKMICWCHTRELLSSDKPLGTLVAEATGVSMGDPKAISWALLIELRARQLDNPKE
jgi:hypothetical protein